MARPLLFLGVVVGATAAVSLPSEADWIVVGGGAAGCTAAAALVDAGQSVVVVERGPSDLSVNSTQTGWGWGKVVAQAVENIRWTDGPWGAVANVLGGGASVNDGYFFEEDPEFLTDLMQFSKDDLSAYYASSKYLADTLLTPLPNTSYGSAWMEAVASAGFTTVNESADLRNIRYKDGTWTVNSLFNSSQPMWPRMTPAVLLHQRAGNPKLTVVLETHVTKVLFEGVRAVGVEVKGEGWFSKTKRIVAKKGVLMAAGAIYTPQLLQVSGVGDARTLKELNITPVVNVPGVGDNFVDRLTWAVAFLARSNQPHFLGYTVSANTSMGVTFESVGGKDVLRYMAIPSLGLVSAKKRVAALRPLMEVLMSDDVAGGLLNHGLSSVGLTHGTASRGTVRANAAKDVTKPPIVTANYFNATGDLDMLVATLKALVRAVEQPSLDPYRTKKAFEPPKFAEVWNASHVETLRALGLSVDEKTGLPDFLHCLFEEPAEAADFIALPCLPRDPLTWGEYLRENVLSTYHYFGTAAVGRTLEPGTFKVVGAESLYVIDASAIPAPTRINPVGTIMSIGHLVGTKLGNSM